MTAVTDSVVAMLDPVAIMLGELADRAASRFEASVPTPEDIDALDPFLIAALSRDPEARAGVGLVFAPGAVRGEDRLLHWYWQTDDQPPARLRANVDPTQPEFYDYTMAGWYRRPYTPGRANLTGPYVDYICSNEYVFTMAVPIIVGARFVGLAAADVRAAQVEHALTARLARTLEPLVIANDEGRIIASNIGRAVPGGTIGTTDAALMKAAEQKGDAAIVLPWHTYRLK